MNIGLYFGSFNPIHTGHLAIANYMVEWTEIDSLWFVVSPHNPLKKKSTLLADHHRLDMVHIGIEDDLRFQACDIELHLPKPSYTIDTLTYLSEKYPKHSFYLIMGSDNIESLYKWKNYEQILEHYNILVYPRPGFKGSKYLNLPNVNLVNAPLMEISSSFIRQSVVEKKSVKFFIPEKVMKYMYDMNFYK